MKSDTACPLLNEDKLCSIQKELGESYLSNVCSTYPRVTNQVNEILEKSATLSCPEAARLALLNPEGIQFNEIEESIHSRNIISKKLNTNRKIAIQKMESYFWELRIFTIQVLQNRSYSLADRVIILGMFYQKVQEYINEGNLSGIRKHFHRFLSGISFCTHNSLNSFLIYIHAYIMLVVHYSLIKLHLIGMAGHHKEAFDLDHVIN